MTDQQTAGDADIRAAEAVVETRHRFSIVWIVPLVALVVGAWLIYKTLTETGPSITITFPTAGGIVAGKTPVKYKDVEAGMVDSVEFGKDLKSVIVKATLAKEMEKHLSENTRFWVVRARIAAGQVSGLGTLLSGVYIGMDPGEPGKGARHFKGLALPPVVAGDVQGRRFRLEAKTLGSLGIGSPIYFRQIKVGSVAAYTLEEDGRAVKLTVFIDAPYDELVRQNTRFWNASGISAEMTADGFQLHAESLTALLIGGISFDTPQTLEPSAQVPEDHVFILYPNMRSATEPVYTRTQRYIVYFNESVRGLKVGAPVEFRGIRIGQVLDLKLEAVSEELSFRIPVLIEIEPDRIAVVGPQVGDNAEDKERRLVTLVDKGLRARLKTGSFLTGQLFVDFDFFPDAPASTLAQKDGYYVLPSVKGSLDELQHGVSQLLVKLQKLPIEEIGINLRDTLKGTNALTNSPELRDAVKNLNATLVEARQMTARLNSEVAPRVQEIAAQVQEMLALLQKNVINEDSPVYHELTRTLDELSEAARSIRLMADYLERHPDALIKGKRGH